MSPPEPDDLARLLLQVLVILGVSRVLAIAARRLGQPAVIAEIVAGIVLGPSLLGWLAPGVFASLFPPESFSGLKLVSQLGLVLFMFLVGLELDAKLLRGRTHVSVLVGAASIGAPLALGVAAAPWLHARYGEGAPFVPFALFLAAAVSVTAFPVLARILSERHLLSTRIGAIAIACAAVDDLTAWCLLTLLIAAAREGVSSDALVTTGLALGFVAIVLFALRPLLSRTVRRIERRGELGTAAITAVLFAMLLVAATSELLGVHALFGAFLFGAVLPKDGPLAEVIGDKLETVTVVLLLPLFFAYSGLRTQLTLLDQPADWIATALIVVLATAGKLGGSALVARLTGLPWREASAVGILLNTRGLMGLIVLNVGLDLGVVSPTLFAMLVIMAFATTLLTSPLLRMVYPDRVVIEERFAEESPAPGTVVAPRAASQHDVVVACVSDPRSGPALAALAHALAGERSPPTRVFGLHLSEPSDRASVERRQPPGAEPAALGTFLSRARASALDVRPLAFVSSTPADDIVHIAEAKRASTIILGAHEPWLFASRLGGAVRDVVRHARATIGILVGADREPPAGGFTKILVAHAGPEDAPVLDVARRLALTPGARIEALFVVAPGDRGATLPAISGVSVRRVEHTSPRDAVASAAVSGGCELLVIGLAKHWHLIDDRGGGARGSFVTNAGVPILVVHDGRAVTGRSPVEAS